MSTPELVVDIEPGGGESLRLCVHAFDLAPIDDEVERPRPRFVSADLDELRSGGASERVAAAIAEQVTSWLLQNDLRGHLGTALHAAAQPFRIVIRPHPKVVAELGDVPFELLQLGADPLALQPLVRAIVHRLKQQRTAAMAPRRSWPLRILLVRSNPGDLGGQVPPALPLRDAILEIARSCGFAGMVEVRALSSEPGGGGPVTYDAFRAELRAASHSVLVYLGHGDLQDAGFDDLPPIGVLQFELSGSPYANPISAAQIRNELLNRPVPVVLLMGCLTAASEAVRKRLPQWMRGSQSVAEALLHGESGVQCAVGMRHRLEAGDAERFLRAFFLSLLRHAPGDVEQAVRAGRGELFAQKVYPPSWSAPVLFRSGDTEPVFDFLGAAPGLIDPFDEHDQELRRKVWKALRDLPASQPPEARRFSSLLLDTVESAFLERKALAGASVLWPARVEARPGEPARVSVQHAGSLQVMEIEGRLRFTEAIAARAPEARAALVAAGARVFFSLEQPGEVRFIARSRSRDPMTIAAGPLFDVELTPPASFPVAWDLEVDALECEPRALLCGWSNAIVVPAP